MDANWFDMDGPGADQEFLRALCKWARMAPSALAKAANLTPTTILRPYNGTATTRLSQTTLGKLRLRFPRFPGWRTELPDLVGMEGDYADPNERVDDLAYVRQVDISYAMGPGATIDDYPTTALIPFNMSFIRAVSGCGTTESLRIVTGHGDSMEKTLLRSDLLMMDTSQRDVVLSDLIWALTYAGGGMIKRIRRVMANGRECFRLMSDNPDVPDETVPVEEVYINGRIIWAGRRL